MSVIVPDGVRKGDTFSFVLPQDISGHSVGTPGTPDTPPTELHPHNTKDFFGSAEDEAAAQAAAARKKRLSIMPAQEATTDEDDFER